jgi:hypothetical protein
MNEMISNNVSSLRATVPESVGEWSRAIKGQCEATEQRSASST